MTVRRISIVTALPMVACLAISLPAIAQLTTPRRIPGVVQPRVPSNGPVSQPPPKTARSELTRRLPTVPNVVGSEVSDAERALQRAGYQVTFARVAHDPTASFLHGDIVTAQKPAAGDMTAGGLVTIEVPTAPFLLAKGLMGPQDYDRRDGYDLDTLRYEQITHGADIVLVRQPVERRQNESGSAEVEGGELAIEAVGGARVAWDRDNRLNGVENGLNYSTCKMLLAANSAPIPLLVSKQFRGSNDKSAGCVRTASGNIAVVEYNPLDNADVTYGNSTISYKLRFAVFSEREAARARSVEHMRATVTK